MDRKKINFDKDWTFYRGDVTMHYAIKAGCTGSLTVCTGRESGEWTEIAYDDKETEVTVDKSRVQSVTLPHDWMVEGDFSREAWRDQGYLHTGVGCYRKEFDMPEEYRGKCVSVDFDGIARNSTLWVNGHLIGSHFSGYSSFGYDISEYLLYGDEGKNCIFIKVDAREYEGWWYEGAGIYRHVYLTVTDKLHVKKWGTFVTTDFVGDEAKVKIETEIQNRYTKDVCAICETTIYDAEGREAAQHSEEFAAEGLGERKLTQTFTVKNPKLWEIESPRLYTAETVILKDGNVEDTYTTVFGIRKAEFKKDGFYLNGKRVDLKGTCNHQDFAGVGIALPDAINEFKIRKLKEMGSNAYRCSHHPPTPELLEACDRLGMLVMDENRKLDCSPRGIEDLTSLILRDRNHPSVIIWCIDNEESILGTITGKRIETRLRDIVHKLDPTRPTTVAMNHGWNENNYQECVDIMGYNYGQRQEQYIHDMERFPDRWVICTESTSSTTTRGIYKENEEMGYCSSYETHLASWCCTHEKSWLDYKANPNLMGIFVWTGFDYRGEPTPYSWPCISSHFGIMDTCGLPKDAYYYYKSVWTDEPTVHLMPHWDLKEEGECVTVRIFSNCDSVELFLNGRLLGEKAMVKDAHIDFDVKYEKGEIKAVGKIGGREVCDCVRRTANAAERIVLEADRTALAADGCDAAVVYAKIYDADGNIVPYADNLVEFSVSGGARIIGVGNGDPSSHEADRADKRRAFSGACMVIVKSGEEKEKVTLTARSKSLKEDSVEIEIS